MRRLVLFRHAKAVRPAPELADIDRVLEPRGRVEAARAAQLLADLGVAIDVALVSPAARTRQTWEVLADTLTAGEVVIEPRIYDADPETLIDLAAEQADADTVMIVGHNPGLKDAARLAMGGGPHDARALEALARGLPTSCALVLGLNGTPMPGAARLSAFVAPERAEGA